VLNLIANSFHHTKLMAQYGVSFWSVLIFDSIKIPYSIHESMPLALGVTTMLSVITLIRSNEMLAYVSLGGRLKNMLFPFLGIGVVIFMLLIVMGDKINPWVEIQRKKFETEQFDRKAFITKDRLTDVWMKDGDEGFVHMELVDPINREFRGITLYRLDDTFEIDRVKSIEYASPINGSWVYHNVIVYDLKPRPELAYSAGEEKVTSRLFSDLADLPVNKPKFLSMDELSKIIKVMKNQKLNASAYELMLYKNFSHAFSAVIVMLLVFPLCINFSRQHSYIFSAVNGLGAAVGYWVIAGSFQSVGKTGVISPIMVNIIPHTVFFLLAVYLIYKKEKAS
jgi:lipopolysaccharide export system permease protein